MSQRARNVADSLKESEIMVPHAGSGSFGFFLLE